MAKTQKPKSGKTRNDDRKNGKAFKSEGAARGSRRTPLTEAQKVYLGGGMLRKWDSFNKEQTLIMKARERKKKVPEVFDI